MMRLHSIRTITTLTETCLHGPEVTWEDNQQLPLASQWACPSWTSDHIHVGCGTQHHTPPNFIWTKSHASKGGWVFNMHTSTLPSFIEEEGSTLASIRSQGLPKANLWTSEAGFSCGQEDQSGQAIKLSQLESHP